MKYLPAIRVFLLVLIIIGLGLLATQKYWVTPLVDWILVQEDGPVAEAPQAPAPAATSTKPVSVPAPHPIVVPPAKAQSGVDGTVTVGPTCPVMRTPPDPQCADKPYQTTLVLASTIIGRNGGVLISSDAQGHFSHDLAPGTYTLRAQSSDLLPRLQPMTFEVSAGKRTTLQVQFDSGIR